MLNINLNSLFKSSSVKLFILLYKIFSLSISDRLYIKLEVITYEIKTEKTNTPIIIAEIRHLN